VSIRQGSSRNKDLLRARAPLHAAIQLPPLLIIRYYSRFPFIYIIPAALSIFNYDTDSISSVVCVHYFSTYEFAEISNIVRMMDKIIRIRPTVDLIVPKIAENSSAAALSLSISESTCLHYCNQWWSLVLGYTGTVVQHDSNTRTEIPHFLTVWIFRKFEDLISRLPFHIRSHKTIRTRSKKGKENANPCQYHTATIRLCTRVLFHTAPNLLFCFQLVVGFFCNGSGSHH
jgi:hypothetical protein